jgi:hypothetical protein
MLQRFCNKLVVLFGHWRFSLLQGRIVLCLLAVGITCKVHAQQPAAPATTQKADVPPICLPKGDGYLRARIVGAIKAELDWGNTGTECTGGVRPTDGGIRMHFRHTLPPGAPLILVFGIAKLPEGRSSRAVPVNVTLIREGTGEFFSTQGDDKCVLDEVRQEPIAGIPRRQRSYRVVVRGFCTEPAHAVRGRGAVMLSRFDYAGRVDFDSTAVDPPAVASTP